MPVSVEPRVTVSIREFKAWEVVRGVDRPSRDEIHVWYAIRDSATPDAAFLQQFLAAEDKARAGRFRFDDHRHHFVTSHAMLRILLGTFSGVGPQEIQFTYGAHGKPANDRDLALTFNLSHADDIVLCAFANRRQIGVDVERVRTDFNVEEIGERFFSAAERAALRRVAVSEKHDAFFRLWTRKEAYIKARGAGLSHPLHQFDVSLDDGANLLMNTRPDREDATRWMVRGVSVPKGYVAAVCFEAEAVD